MSLLAMLVASNAEQESIIEHPNLLASLLHLPNSNTPHTTHGATAAAHCSAFVHKGAWPG